jgi:hypothetical protein
MSAEKERAVIQEQCGESYGSLVRKTFANVDAKARVDAPRHKRTHDTSSTCAHDKQPSIINHAKRYRAARRAKETKQ